MAKLRRASPVSLDDDNALLAMARMVLGGPTDEGRSSYQIAMTVCEHCGSGRQQACGELIDVADEVVEMAACDAQHVGETDTHLGTHAACNAQHVGEIDTHVGVRPRSAPRPTA